MGVGKEHPAFGQRVNIRCLYLRMALESSHPVIEIINGDEENIGFAFAATFIGKAEQQNGENYLHRVGFTHLKNASLGFWFHYSTDDLEYWCGL